MTSSSIQTTVERWIAAFSQPTAQEICDLYTEDSVLLATIAPEYRNTPELIRGYFDEVFKNNNRLITLTELNIQEQNGFAICSGFYTFSWDGPIDNVNLQARFTFVLVQEQGCWRIKHHHSSALPYTKQTLS